MALDGNSRPGGPGKGAQQLLTVTVEGNPTQLCRRTVYGTVDGLVFFQMVLTTIAQPSVAQFLRDVANEFAKREGGIITGGN